MLGLQRQPGDHVELGCKQVDWGAHVARMLDAMMDRD